MLDSNVRPEPHAPIPLPGPQQVDAASARPHEPVPPVGWYPTAEGSHERYWDGASWSEARPVVAAAEPEPAPAPEPVSVSEPPVPVPVPVPAPEPVVVEQVFDPFVSTPPLHKDGPAVEDPIDSLVWSLVITDAPYDPYADLPDYATVPPLPRTATRSASGSQEEKVSRAIDDAAAALGRAHRAARPSWAGYALSFFGFWTVGLMLLAQMLLATMQTSSGATDGMSSDLVGLAVAFPVALLLAWIDLNRARTQGVPMSRALLIFPPAQCLARALQSRSFIMTVALGASVLAFFTWWAPMGWIDWAAPLFGMSA